jgi:hypothetical protein
MSVYHTARFVVIALRFVYAWAAIATVLGYGHQYLNRPFRWLPYAREAVFPWYVLHQSVLLAISFWLIPLRLGPVLEPVLILAGMVVGCALLHVYVIRRSRWLRPLFGLDAKPPQHRQREPMMGNSTCMGSRLRGNDDVE